MARIPTWEDLTSASLGSVLGRLGLGALLLFAAWVGPATRGRLVSPRDVPAAGPEWLFDWLTRVVSAREALEIGPYEWFDWLIGGLAVVLIFVSALQLARLLFTAVGIRAAPRGSVVPRHEKLRTIYELLLGVAASDGTIDPYERDAVGNVMLHRLPDVVTKQDLKNWSTTIEPPRDPVALARCLVDAMTEHERAALWEWRREVAAVDGADDDEHDVLRKIRAVLKPTNFAAGLRK